MISFLRGHLHACQPTQAQVEVGGVGYGLIISLSTYEQLKSATEAKVTVYTHLHVSDSAQTLYGFATEDEKAMFLQLIGLTGIGPSIALAALSTYLPTELRQLIQSEEVSRIQQVKGIGKKMAQRIILELADKLTTGAESTENAPAAPSLQEEALQALLALGLTRTESERSITKAVSQAKEAPLTVEELVKKALRSSK